MMNAFMWAYEDPTGWWMSEKLDGIRAYWNGKQFVSRNGRHLQAPLAISEDFQLILRWTANSGQDGTQRSLPIRF